jgi:hypothetical protein
MINDDIEMEKLVVIFNDDLAFLNLIILLLRWDVDGYQLTLNF